MAPRERIAILSILTMQIVLKGSCTRRILSVLLGCWIHILLFRRALFAVIDQLFKEGSGKPQDEIFPLSRQARCELQMLAVLGPIAQSDIRVQHCPRMYCTDASPMGGAVIYADIGQNAAQEFWRHSGQRGFYTRLQSPVAEILAEKGFEPESNKKFITKDNPPQLSPAPGRALSEGIIFDCIEIFRGEGNWSEAHKSRGFRVHDGVDISGRRLRIMDLSDAGVFHELKALALRRVCLDWHAGVPCPSFGTLRRPQVRSKTQPAGFDPSDPYTAYHNRLARRTAFLMTLVFMSGHFFSVEQPGSSRLFLLHCFRVLVSMGCVISHFCFCSYGSPFQKASKWLHNKPWIVPLESKCTCGYRGNHFIVQGGSTAEAITDFESRCNPSSTKVYGRSPKVGESVASYSAQYPLKLVHSMASGLQNALRGLAGPLPLEVKLCSLAEVGFDLADLVPNRSTEPVFPDRAWHECPEWIAELCESLSFREAFRYKFRKPGHINVNELRTFKSFIKSCAKSEPDSRIVAMLDSRVSIGAASKGRSSSPALSKILRGCLAYIIGGGSIQGCCTALRN